MKAIPLTRGFAAIISKEDWPRVRRHKWRVHFSAGTKKKVGQPYARATIKGKETYLHRFVTQAPGDKHVDHKNHQTLDCRQENLEVVEAAVNISRKRKKPKRVSASLLRLLTLEENQDV